MSKRDKKLTQEQQIKKWVEEENKLPADKSTVSRINYLVNDVVSSKKLSFRQAFRFAHAFCMLDLIINEPDIDY